VTAPQPAVAGAAAPARRWRLVVRGRDVTLNAGFLVAALIFVVVAASTSDTFLTVPNQTNLLKQMVTTGLLAFGMLLVILTGGIDLSVGSVLGFAGVFSAGMAADLPLPLAILLGVVTGAAFGAVNGTLVAWFQLAPFVVTLASLTTIRGLTYVYSKTPITPEDPGFLTLGSKLLGPIPLASLIMLAVFALLWFFLSRTAPGRSLIAIGGNAETVRLAGINVRGHVLTAYVLSGTLAALAGVTLASRVGIAQPSTGVGFELDAIAACVIGGASLSGGRGSVPGTLAGVVLLALINNLLNLYNVQSYWQQVLKGLIIVGVILIRRREQ
jgi:ribose/xylose/arabinose/galactoside ABC-type transport system permease subunit